MSSTDRNPFCTPPNAPGTPYAPETAGGEAPPRSAIARLNRRPVSSCPAMELIKGANTPLSCTALEITVAWASAIEGEGRVGLDVCALRLGADARVREDTDFVFFNMPVTPDGTVRHGGPATDTAPPGTQGETILVELGAQPTDVSSIVVTATIDVATPELTFSGIPITATVHESGSRSVVATFVPPPLTTERALTVLEVYRRNDVWKLRAIGQGYESGLAGLANDFGVDIEPDPDPLTQVLPEEPAPTPAPAVADRMPIDMRKRLDLRKRTVSVVLTKAGIAGHRARVAVVLDASGSMFRLYLQGTIARVVERLAAVAATLDDDATLDVWSYATNPLALPPLQVDVMADWIALYVRTKSVSTGAGGARATKERESAALAAGRPVPDWSSIGGQNDEAKVMQLVLDHYRPLPTPPPVLVVFITDGGLYRSREIEKILRTSSALPVFWQFVGVGKASYGVLEKLDTLTGRTVDNAGFFAVDDLDSLQDDQLYSRLLSEFPAWLRSATAAGIPV
jgi:stress response protein SCP2